MPNHATTVEAIRQDNRMLPHHAWPGLYPLYYVDNSGSVCCPECANDDTDDPDWWLVMVTPNYEDQELYCNYCGTRIEPAYEEDDE